MAPMSWNIYTGPYGTSNPTAFSVQAATAYIVHGDRNNWYIPTVGRRNSSLLSYAGNQTSGVNNSQESDCKLVSRIETISLRRVCHRFTQ